MQKTTIKPADIARVKGMGFLLNRGTNEFSGRVVPVGCVFTAGQLARIAECADRFGNGKVAFTTRLTAEIVGIPYENIGEAAAYMEQCGLKFGGTGAKIRPVTACKGTTCVYGNCDTQAIAREIHEKYYLGWSGVKLPHKFKIAVGGCPNSCMKPSLNDFGIEAHRVLRYDDEKCRSCKVCMVEKNCPMKAATLDDSQRIKINHDVCNTCGVCNNKCPFGAITKHEDVEYQIFVGGTWGKHTRNGTPLSRMVEYGEVFPLLEKTMLWFKKYSYEKERLGAAIDRIGVDKLEEELFSNVLLEQKEDILTAEVNKRA